MNFYNRVQIYHFFVNVEKYFRHIPAITAKELTCNVSRDMLLLFTIFGESRKLQKKYSTFDTWNILSREGLLPGSGKINYLYNS
jgi:hypothetical protein